MGSLDDLLVVQELDTRTDQLLHRRERSAERDAVAGARAAVDDIERRLATANGRLHDLRARERALEDEAALVEDHAAEVQRTLYGGTITAAKELEAFQADHDMLKRRQADLEDKAIEILEAAEPIEAEVAALAAERERCATSLADAESGLIVAEAEIAAELDRIEVDRAAAAAGVPPEVLAAYEPLRKSLGGIGAARLNGARCEGCHLEIPSAQLEAVRKAADDGLVTCPECGRLLVR